MPSKKKKYSARFPPARIKKIMQTDEDVGKVAAAVPVLISRALERFIETLIVRTSETTQSKNAKTLTSTHIKQTIHAEKKFDFLKDLVAAVPDHQTEEDADNGGGQGDTKKPKIPRQKKQKEGGRKKRKTKNSSESSENEANGEEEEEEKEETSSTDTDEEMNEHSQMYAKSPNHLTNCKQETNYPIPSFSGHVMQPPINQVSDQMPPNCPMQTAPTVGGSIPALQENHFPNQTGLPFPMQVNNVMPQQTQPLDLCSSNSMYQAPMYSVTGYPYPQNYMCGQTLAPFVAPSSSKDQQLISPESKTLAPEGQSSQTSSEKQTLSSFPPVANSQPRPMAAGPTPPQLPISLSSFTKLSTPQVCEDDDYDT